MMGKGDHMTELTHSKSPGVEPLAALTLHVFRYADVALCGPGAS